MLVHQQQVAVPAVVNPASAPRKRRRRAPATGAAEDCFTCRANGTKCDRRRPYCGPCLEASDECKGYRTQLTWGVGVASRGKLRGMTLPVSIESNISVAERDRRCAVRKKSLDEPAIKAKRLRTALEMTTCLNDNGNRHLSGDIDKLSIITNYNMEHPSSAPPAINTAISNSDFSRPQRSPTSTVHSLYTTSLVYTPLMVAPSYPPVLPHQQQRHGYPSAVINFHKSPYPYEPMNSHHGGALLISPGISGYDRAYSPHSESPYSLSPSPSDSSLYEAGLSVPSAFAPITPSLVVASSVPPYTPLITSLHPGPQDWSRMGGGSLHQQHVALAGGNPSDLLYGDEMLGTF